MSLTLAVLRCPDDVAPETRTIAGGEFSIGRGAENDWVLPDPERALSKRHCVIAFRSGGWQITDFSTNGTFLNRDGEPIGRGQARDLRSGDRLSLGAYEIEIQVVEDAAAVRPVDPYAARRSASPELFALDPFATPTRGDGGMAGDPLLGGRSDADPYAAAFRQGGVSLPPDFDPLAPDPEAPEFRGPIQPDHTPHIEDAFAPPAARSVLPDDWDRDLVQSGAIPPRPATGEPLPPAPVVVAREITEPPPRMTTADRPLPDAQTAPAGGPRADRSDAVLRGRDSANLRPIAAAAAISDRSLPSAEPAPAGGARDDLMEAFLRGCGSPGLRPADAAAAMEGLGAAFRAFVAGLRQAIIARAAVKGEFRIEQTMIRSRGNNPLKFSADDDDAMAALLGIGRRSDMGAAEAVADALRDIRLHELATVTAMQAAVRALLAEFDPAKLRQTTEHGGLSLLAAQRKANAWDAFEALHSRITQALLDDFDSVFGKAFARAYERAVAEISVREPDAS